MSEQKTVIDLASHMVAAIDKLLTTAATTADTEVAARCADAAAALLNTELGKAVGGKANAEWREKHFPSSR
jgi:hypothetical protein